MTSQSAVYLDSIIGRSRRLKTLSTGKDCEPHQFQCPHAGVSGTGKEVLPRQFIMVAAACGPFVTVNCAALPRELVGSELFGYDEGLYRSRGKAGREVELANGGTLLLDE